MSAASGPSRLAVSVEPLQASEWILPLSDPAVSSWIAGDGGEAANYQFGVAVAALSDLVDDPDGLMARVAGREIDAETTRMIWRDLVEQASGRPWWETLRIIGLVLASWHPVLGGRLRRLISPMECSLGEWVDVAYALLLELVPEDKAKALHSEVTAPHLDVVDGEESMDESAFTAAASERLGW